jgi:hypothetical protein
MAFHAMPLALHEKPGTNRSNEAMKRANSSACPGMARGDGGSFGPDISIQAISTLQRRGADNGTKSKNYIL